MLLVSDVITNIIKLISLFVVFILIIIACYWVTRFVGTKQMSRIKDSNFKVLDMHRLGQNQCLMIVEVGSRYFCIGVSKDNISTICELDRDDIRIQDSSSGQMIKSFSSVFSGVLKKNNPDAEDKSCKDEIEDKN